MATLINSWVNKAHVLKAALHCHTTNSDGHDTSTDMVETYKSEGFDVVCITDHDYATPDPSVADILFIPGVEETVANGPNYADQHHVSAVNMTSQNTSSDSTTVFNAITSAGGFAVINHPLTEAEGGKFPIAEAEEFNGLYDAIELENVYGFPMAALDLIPDAYTNTLYNEGFRFWLTGCDDAHWKEDGYQWGTNKAWVMINADSVTVPDVIANLKAGNFYVSMGPLISSISDTGYNVTITVPAQSTIEWMTAAPTVSHVDMHVTVATYTVPSSAHYVRAVITRDSDHKRAWTQPLFVDAPTPQPIDDTVAGIIPCYRGAGKCTHYAEAVPPPDTFENTGNELILLKHGTASDGCRIHEITVTSTDTHTHEDYTLALSHERGTLIGPFPVPLFGPLLTIEYDNMNLYVSRCNVSPT